jgi:hypothetical protein
MHPQPIPVICDRCRAQGLAGEDPFAAFGALLDFDPVPRRTHRADGWDAEVQRAFIAALSLTGSERAACRAVAKSPYGVIQLLAHEGADGFRAAYDEAMAMAADERGRRLAEGVQAVAAEQSGWRPPDQPFAGAAARRGPGRPRAEEAFASAAPAPPPEDDEAAHMALLGALLESYMIKLESERRCRLEGRIAEADFYIRQVTMLEVSIDVVGGNGMEILKRARRGGHDLLRIAETPMSQLLDEARRLHFADCGDPPRPEYPPRHLLVEGKNGVMLEPSPGLSYNTPEPIAEQRQRIDDQLARDAQAQVEWEAEARRDYERRRAAPPLIDGEPRPAGQPAPGLDPGDRTDVTNSVRDGAFAEACPEQGRREPGGACPEPQPPADHPPLLAPDVPAEPEPPAEEP